MKKIIYLLLSCVVLISCGRDKEPTESDYRDKFCGEYLLNVKGEIKTVRYFGATTDVENVDLENLSFKVSKVNGDPLKVAVTGYYGTVIGQLVDDETKIKLELTEYTDRIDIYTYEYIITHTPIVLENGNLKWTTYTNADILKDGAQIKWGYVKAVYNNTAIRLY